MKVLIADDDPALVFFLTEVIQNCGHIPLTASDGREALQIFEAEQPEIVLSDLRMPEIDGLSLLEKVRKRNPEVFFVVLTGWGSEEEAVRALQLRASNYLIKPVRHEVISQLINKYSQIMNGRLLRSQISRMVQRREMTLRIDNRINLVSEVGDYLLAQTDDLLDQTSRFGIHLGLFELIMNAIEHGNMEINFEEKRRLLQNGPDRLSDMYEKRLQNPTFSGRRVTIDFKMSGTRLEWVIQDEGPGFDYRSLPNPLAPENFEAVNGRGVFLAGFQFDELTFLGAGNKVRAVKHIIPGGNSK